MMPLAGKIGDQFGRKQVFLDAVVLFTAASLCCGLAGNIYLLIALRGMQALGGGAFMPSATGIVAELFGENRDRAVGLFASIFPIGWHHRPGARRRLRHLLVLARDLPGQHPGRPRC